jgi:hypothetical protein
MDCRRSQVFNNNPQGSRQRWLKTDGAVVYKQVSVDAKLKTGRKV